MLEKCKSCGSCGMAMEKPEDFAGGNLESLYCSYCADDEGQIIVTFDEVVASFAEDLVNNQGFDDQAALHTAIETIKVLPAWRE